MCGFKIIFKIKLLGNYHGFKVKSYSHPQSQYLKNISVGIAKASTNYANVEKLIFFSSQVGIGCVIPLLVGLEQLLDNKTK